MKKQIWRVVFLFFIGIFFLATSIQLCNAQAGTLRDETTGGSLDASAKKIIILIHGWNPNNESDMFLDEPWPSLISSTKQELLNSDWRLFTFHWEQGTLLGANTGPIYNWKTDGFDVEGVGNAVVAAIHADQQGHNLAALLNQTAPNLRRVHLIAHSAGAWVAREAAADILQSNPYVTVQITLLDPFIPDVIPEQSTGLSDSYMGQLSTIAGNDRISRLENYYADDLETWFPTDQIFSWRTGDINQEVDWSSLFSDYYDAHSGPIQFYQDTVYQSIPGNSVPAGLYGLGCPFDYSQVGWLRSLFYTDEIYSPGIAIQPQGQSAASGTSVTLNVTASSSQPLVYQWFHSGQAITGANNASYSFTLNSSSAGDYVVKISYQNKNGFIFSDKATMSMVVASPPSISTVYPSSLVGLPIGQTQLIRIIGSGFTGSSTLTFNDGVDSPYTGRIPTFVSANELDYNISTGTNQVNWNVQVVNGSQTSNLGYFNVTAPSASSTTGSLVVNLSPTSAVSAGAQWQVDGGSYQSSGAVVASLSPGSHSVSFKAISGYSTPSSQSVNIVANSQSTLTGTYTANLASTYTLTLNQGSTGYVVNSPSGTWNGSAYVYTASSVVQLTANADPGYHFVGWGGDASGTSNPITVTMNGNKNVTANFASGDPTMGTIIVTIQPPAAAAGVQWGWNSTDYRNSGTSYTTFAGNYFITLHPVDGWISPAASDLEPISLVAGQTTNYTYTFTQDTTPGLLTVTLSPPDAVTAGAQWHVNGGVAQGNGATVSLPPGTNYTVTFDSVSGWTAPQSQTVSVGRAQTTVINGNYTPPAGQPIITSISPPIGSSSGGTLLTIAGANFTSPATVRIGGNLATNVIVSSSTQITCLTPSSSTNGTVPIIVQLSGGSATNLNGFTYGMARGSKLDLISAIGGSCLGVTAQGNYAYVGEGRNLLVLDVSSPSSPSKVGQITLPGIIRSVALFQQYACVADGEGGLQMVDISTPAAPKVVGYYATTNQVWAAGVSVLGGRAYVADEFFGLQIYDLGNPAQPALLSSTNIGSAQAIITKASANGVFAYLTTGGSLCIIDVSNPLAPNLLGQTAMGSGGVSSIAMSGNYVFGGSLYDFSIHMVDVSNPASPVDSKPSAGGYGTCDPYAMTFANNYLYVASGFSSGGFLVFSINGNDLVKVGQAANIPFSGFNMFASGTKVYVAAGGAFDMVDVSSPSSPSLLSSFTDSGVFYQYNSVAVTGNTLAACGYPEGTTVGFHSVFNVSNPSVPTFAANPNTGGSSILANNGIAYVLAGMSNLIYNVSTPSSPQLLKLFANTESAGSSMALNGNMLYVTGYGASVQPRLVAIDVSTPSSPTIRGAKDFTEFSSGVATCAAVNGNKGIVGIQTYTSPNQNEVITLDMSNVGSPAEQGSFTNLSSFPKATQLSANGNYAYVLVAGPPTSLYVLNITQPNNPTLVTNIALDNASGTDLKIQGNELFAATYTGLHVFDISNPSSPAPTRTFAVMSEVSGIGVTSDSANQAGFIYLATQDGGLVVLKEEDIQAPDIYITDPIFGNVWTNTTSTMSLGGGSDDNVGVTAITWSNSRGGSGQVNAPFDNWFVNGIRLYPGTNLISVTAFDAAGNAGSDSLTVVYPSTNLNQTITFSPIADQTFGGLPVQLVAAASSGLPVTFSVISGAASTSNNILTITGAGAITVEANQLGNNSYNAATPVDVSFNVARANQSITLPPVPAKSAGDAPFPLAATTSSGLPASFSILSGPALVDTNGIVTLLGSGTITFIAWQSGNSNFNAAATVQGNFSVSKIPQTISFGALSPAKMGDAPFPLNATASSSLPVSYSISGPATLSGNIVVLNSYGTVSVTASQPGNGVYTAAANVTESFSVAPPDNTIVNPTFVNGRFQMTFYGVLNDSYAFQSSSNLTGWTTLFGFTCTISPTNLIDATSTNASRRFYRLKTQ